MAGKLAAKSSAAKTPASDAWLPAGTPRYREVRRRIVEAIDASEWRSGQSIPSERKLCERFGVSMGTLRKAVDELTASGMLVRRQGLGTFVAGHSHDRYLFAYFHLVGRDGHKEYPGVRFHRFDVAAADSFAASLLGLRAGARLYHLSNVLSLRGEVASIDEVYIPAVLFSGLTEQRLRSRQTTLYQMYQDEFQLTVARVSERIRACLATREQARLLETRTGTPLLEIVRMAYTLRGRAIELRYSYVNTQRCEYRPNSDVGG
jgi:GntR family transcriptional regulator